MAFCKVKNPVVCAKLPVPFTQLIGKFLKFEEMEYLIHHIKVKIWPVLCYVPILFSAVKLKLGHNFSQFIYRFKIRTIESWTKSVLPSFSQFTMRLKTGISDCCPCWNSKFFPVHWKYWKLGFWSITLDCTSKFFPVH